MRVARLEAEPKQVLEAADIDKQPVQNMCWTCDIVWATVGMPTEDLFILRQLAGAMRSPQSHHEMCGAKVPSRGYVLWYD